MQLSYEMHFSVRWKNVVVNTRRRKKKMGRTLLALLVAGSLLVALNVSSAPGQVPDGTVKITSRMVAPGIGLSWGEGVFEVQGPRLSFHLQGHWPFPRCRHQDRRCRAFRSRGRVEAL